MHIYIYVATAHSVIHILAENGFFLFIANSPTKGKQICFHLFSFLKDSEMWEVNGNIQPFFVKQKHKTDNMHLIPFDLYAYILLKADKDRPNITHLIFPQL